MKIFGGRKSRKQEAATFSSFLFFKIKKPTFPKKAVGGTLGDY